MSAPAKGRAMVARYLRERARRIAEGEPGVVDLAARALQWVGLAMLAEIVGRAAYDRYVQPPIDRPEGDGPPAAVEGGSSLRLSFEPETVWVPAGPFLMGTSDAQIPDMARRFDVPESWLADETPQHRVTLPAYRMGRYPVTHDQYAAFVRATGHRRPDAWEGGRVPRGLEHHPVGHVSWDDAQAYVAWLRGRTGRAYRLPTEAEWEKAARGTDARLWPWGDDWDAARCNTSEGGPGTTTPVGQYSPAGDSPCGCADMAGNVWEWVADWYESDYYARSPARTPRGPESGGTRVFRGGAWNDGRLDARSAYRGYDLPGFRGDIVGFRVVVSPALPASDF